MNIIKTPRVFISYAYDSVRHKQQVLEFASFLRAEGGIDIRLDLWDANRRRDWSAWVVEQVREADIVLVVASPAYKRRADGSADPSEGRGVQFESALLRDLVIRARDESVHKVLPVVLPGQSVGEIPAFLQPHAASHYVVDSLTMDGIGLLTRAAPASPHTHFVHSPHRGAPLLSVPCRRLATGDRRPGQGAEPCELHPVGGLPVRC